MVKQQLYHLTVDILYNSYTNNLLEKGNHYASAVGNLVAVAMGYELKYGKGPEDIENNCDKDNYLVWVKEGVVLPHPSYENENKINGWYAPIVISGTNRFIKKEFLVGPALEQINATGYKATELSQIDKAFEAHQFGPTEDQIYYGLIKVLDVLQKIHFVTDKALIEQNIHRFKTHYQSLRK